MIYLIWCEGYVKIGWAKNPSRRLQALQIGSPFPMKLLATIRGDLDWEKKLHSAVSDKHVRGEWYYLGEWDDVANMLEKMQDRDNVTIPPAISLEIA